MAGALEEVVFAYDCSRSSVFAIKQFYYQLPMLADRRVTVLHINREGNMNHKEHVNFKEWLDMHFREVTFLRLTREPREVLFEYFMIQNENNNQLLVTGAFGRNFLSTFF